MYTQAIKTATGSAFGKIILIGEHSAVYEKPAIAIPCTAVQSDVTITAGRKGLYIYCDLFSGLVDDMPEILTSLKAVIHATLLYLGHSRDALHIKIDSSIPLERGMGSSAAVSIALIRAIFNYYGQEADQATLLDLVNISEQMIHGNPSGLDASIIVHEQAMHFQKNHGMYPLSIQMGAYLVIADSGITGRTKYAIEKVKALESSHPKRHSHLINHLSLLTKHMEEVISRKEVKAMGQIMTTAHQSLNLLGVSNKALNKLVKTALDQGALGAKMTGGGLGGCMIALAANQNDAERIAAELRQAGAKQTFIQTI